MTERNNDDNVEQFTARDVFDALLIAQVRDSAHPYIEEALQAARAVRLNYIRKTNVGGLNRSDWGKLIRRHNPTRTPELLNSHRLSLASTKDAPAYEVVIDGYIHDLKPEDPIWIDDTSLPDVSDS